MSAQRVLHTIDEISTWTGKAAAWLIVGLMLLIFVFTSQVIGYIALAVLLLILVVPFLLVTKDAVLTREQRPRFDALAILRGKIPLTLAQRRKRQVEGHRRAFVRTLSGRCGQAGQGHRRGQFVVARRLDELAIRHHDLEFEQPKQPRLQRVRVHLDVPHAPGVWVEGARGLGEPPLVIGVLLLKMLGPEEQAFAPQDLG